MDPIEDIITTTVDVVTKTASRMIGEIAGTKEQKADTRTLFPIAMSHHQLCLPTRLLCKELARRQTK